MLIQLTQPEIEKAIRGYIIKMGVSLNSVPLEISFTSGRQGRGLIADVSFNTVEVPEEDPPVTNTEVLIEKTVADINNGEDTEVSPEIDETIAVPSLNLFS